MTLAFKAALQAFPYPASLVAATFVVEAALVKSAECGARAAACVFPKEETNEPRKCCVFPDETDRLLMYVACCVGAEVAFSNAGLLLLSSSHAHDDQGLHARVCLGRRSGVEARTVPVVLDTHSVSYLRGNDSLFPGRRGSPSSREGLVTRRLADGIGWRRRRFKVGAHAKGMSRKVCAVKPTELVRRTLPTSAAFLVLVAGLLDARRLIRTPGSGDLAQKALGAALALALGGLGLLTVEVTLVALDVLIDAGCRRRREGARPHGVSIGLLKNDVSPSGYGASR